MHRPTLRGSSEGIVNVPKFIVHLVLEAQQPFGIKAVMLPRLNLPTPPKSPKYPDDGPQALYFRIQAVNCGHFRGLGTLVRGPLEFIWLHLGGQFIVLVV